MDNKEDIYIDDRVQEIDKHYVKCPICNGNALMVIYIYRISSDESIAISTLKCDFCGFKFRDVVSLSEMESPICIEIYIEKDIDLNTSLYIPSLVDIEIPQLGIAVEVKSLRIGNIVTVDAIIHYIIESLNSICIDKEAICREIAMQLNDVINGKILKPITLKIKSVYSPLKILKSYRDKNYSYC